MTYTVTFPGNPIIQGTANYTNDRCEIADNNVTFAQSTSPSLGPSTYTILNASPGTAPYYGLVVGLSGSTASTLTTHLSNLTTPAFSVGASDLNNAYPATFNIDGGTVTDGALNGFSFSVLSGSNLNIINGGHLSTSGGSATLTGAVHLGGASSTWTTTGQVVLGDQSSNATSNASILIDGGAHATFNPAAPLVPAMQIAAGSGGSATATVSGAGSTLSLGDNSILRIGSGYVPGTLYAQSGAAINADQFELLTGFASVSGGASFSARAN